MKEWIRWQLAFLLNNFSDTCWTELVLWVINPDEHDFSEIFRMRGTAGRCGRLGEPPYCGKCG